MEEQSPVKWSEGIKPRTFRWVISERLAICERPGGYGTAHRRVRRTEEIIWILRSGIDLIVSLTAAPYNLRDYDEHEIEYLHLPFSGAEDGPDHIEHILRTLHERLATSQILMHQEAINDKVCGLVGAYIRWSGLVPDGPEAITLTERLLERELGPPGRALIGMVEQLDPPTS